MDVSPLCCALWLYGFTATFWVRAPFNPLHITVAIDIAGWIRVKTFHDNLGSLPAGRVICESNHLGAIHSWPCKHCSCLCSHRAWWVLWQWLHFCKSLSLELVNCIAFKHWHFGSISFSATKQSFTNVSVIQPSVMHAYQRRGSPNNNYCQPRAVMQSLCSIYSWCSSSQMAYFQCQLDAPVVKGNVLQEKRGFS